MIHKTISSTGELYVYSNGELIYKRWPNQTSVIIEKYGINTTNADRDRGKYANLERRDT